MNPNICRKCPHIYYGGIQPEDICGMAYNIVLGNKDEVPMSKALQLCATHSKLFVLPTNCPFILEHKVSQ